MPEKRNYVGMALVVLSGLVPLLAQETKPIKDGTVIVESPGTELKGTWKPHDTRLLELLDGYVPQKPPELDRYGGWLVRSGDKATGFFHTAKIGNRWWLVDPDGHLYFDLAVNAVQMSNVSPASTAAFKEKFGTPDVWRDKTLEFLRQTGFLGLGNWSDYKTLHTSPTPLPYTVRLNFMGDFGKSKGLTLPASGHSGYVNDCFPVFLPDFEEWSDNYAKTLSTTASDPFVVGIFSDNELLAPSDLLDKHLALDVTQPNLKPGHDAAVAWLKESGVDPNAITDQDRQAFIAFVFERYFKIVSTAIRKYDPNHLYLGSRVNNRKTQFANQPLWEVLGRYLDVISVNDYHAWGPEPVEDANWQAWSHKPVMITEWYAKALDVPGLANAKGAGWVVKTQDDRGKFYQHFVLGCLESNNIVGVHYFKYMDDPSESVSLDSAGGSNKGLLNSQYEPYAPLVDRARAVNLQAYPLIDFFEKRKKSP